MTLRNRWSRLVLAAFVLFSLFGLAQPLDAQSPAFVVPAKFDAEGLSEFLVPVTVRSKVFWCALDSGGSWVFSMDTATALGAGMTPNSTGSSAGAGPDVRRDERIRGVTAELAGLALPNLTIVLGPRPDIAPDIECVFGLGILQNYVAQFDYAKPELRLFEAGSFRPPSKAALVPFEIDRFRNPYIKTALRIAGDDRADATLILDTGGGYYSVVLVKRFIDAQEIRRRAHRVVAQASHTPGLALSATRLAALSVGGFEVPGPIAALLDTPSAGIIQDGVIGAGFFKHFLVTFDYGRRQMWLEPASPLPARQVFDASGVEFTHAANRRYHVHEVIPGTPAAAAGIQKGDILVSLDGRDARDLTLGDIKDALSTPGATRRFVLMREGVPQSITVLLKELL